MVETARIEVVIDPRRAVQGSRAVVASFSSMTQASRQFDLTLRRSERRTNDWFDNVQQGSRNLVVLARRLSVVQGLFLGVAAAAAGAGGRRFVGLGDQYALLNARLRLASESQAQFNVLQQETFESAQDTRTAFATTIESFTNLERATRSIARSQAELIDVNELVAQSFRLSGASAAAQAGATVQFLQGLQTNFAAAGQEIQSIIEQAPILAQALADGLNEIGVTSNATSGDLKRLAREGVLTTETAFRALLSQTDDIDEQFNSLGRTAGQAGTQLANSFLRAVGAANEASGATEEVVGLIDELREIVESPAFQKGLEGIGLAIAFAARETAEWVSLVGEAVELWEDLPESVREAISFGIRAALNPLETAIEEYKRIFGDFTPADPRALGALRAGIRAENEPVAERTRVPPPPETLSRSELSRVEQLLSRFGGPAEQRARLNEVIAFAQRAQELGALTEAQATAISEGAQREFLDQQLAVIGAIDQQLGATLELEQRRRELQASTEALGLSEVTLARLTSELEEEYADLLEPMAAVTREFQEQQIADRIARDNQLLARSIGELTEEYEKNLEALNELAISEEERARIARDLRIELLENRTDFDAGVERFFEKFIRESQDAASQVEAVLGDAIDSINQALEDLIVTGEISVGNLQETLLRRGTRAALENIEAALFGAFGFGGGGQEAATAANTTATTLNSTATTANTAALAANTAALSVSASTSAISGASSTFAPSAIGGNPIATFLGSFQSGGAGVIPGSGPPDSMLAFARVTPGEPYAFGNQAVDNSAVVAAVDRLAGILASVDQNTRGTERALQGRGDSFNDSPSRALSDTAILLQNSSNSEFG